MAVDPCKPTKVESTAGASDGDAGQACVRFGDGFWDGATAGVVLVTVRGWGEVFSDLHC